MSSGKTDFKESRIDEFVRLWLDPHTTRTFIRERIGCSWADLDRLQKRLNLPDKPNPTQVPFWEPTEAEIEERKLECQAKWTQGRRDYETGASRQGVELRAYSYCRKTMSFS